MRAVSWRSAVALGAALAALLVWPRALAGQSEPRVGPDELRSVFPYASRFSEQRGQPPVFEAYRSASAGGAEALVGYAFLTSDVPPEMTGYNGPIAVLVGMTLDGTLTGVRVVEYHESLQSTRGDFLRQPRFLEQFTDKPIADPFRLRPDLDGITGATITVRAMSLGVRNAARRVAAAYLSRADADSGPRRRYIASVDAAELEPLSWAD